MSQPNENLKGVVCPFCGVEVVSPVIEAGDLLRIHWQRTCAEMVAGDPSAPDGPVDGTAPVGTTGAGLDDPDGRRRLTADIETLQTHLRFLDLWERVEPLSRDALQDEAFRILTMIASLSRRIA